MACSHCGGNRGKDAQSFKFVAPDGTSKVYRNEIEARAAKIRAGGGTITPVVR